MSKEFNRVMVQVLDHKTKRYYCLFMDPIGLNNFLDLRIMSDPDCDLQYVFQKDKKYYSGVACPKTMKIMKRADAVWDNYDKFWNDIYENFCFFRNKWSAA